MRSELDEQRGADRAGPARRTEPQGGGQSAGRDAGAAGQGLGFHTLLESADLQLAPFRLHEIGIHSNGSKRGVPTVTGSLAGYLYSLDIRNELHEMTGAGVEEPSVQSGMELVDINHLQAHRLHPVLTSEQFPGVHSVRCAEMVPPAFRRPDAQMVGKGHNTASSVAAHHP